MKIRIIAFLLSLISLDGIGQHRPISLSIGNNNSAKFCCNVPFVVEKPIPLFTAIESYYLPGPSTDEMEYGIYYIGTNEPKTLKGKNGESFAFMQYVPSGNTPKPLIIFLHGISERGNSDTVSVRAVENNEIPKIIKSGGFAQDAIVLSPQLKSTYGYWPTWQVKELIEYAKSNLNIDPSKIILTGLSMGGGGVWSCLEDETIASQISAAAPVCGTCNYVNGQYIIKYKIPIWIFHAENDATVSVGCSGGAYGDLKKKGYNVKFTNYADGGHSIWSRAYDQGNPTYRVKSPDIYNTYYNESQSPNFYQWAFSFSKAGVVVPPVVTPPAKIVLSVTTINGKTITIYIDGSVEIK